jgi:hypothetical protein
MNMKPEDTVSAVALVVESEAEDADAATLEDTVATEGPVGFDATGGDAEAGGHLPPEHAPAPEESLDPEAAQAAEASLDGAAGVEPDEVDLDEPDGPPTPGA